jgi:hypothetical protein
MKIENLQLPNSVLEPLDSLTKALLNHNLPYFIFLPLEFNPIKAEYYDGTNPVLSSLGRTLHAKMLEHQYSCVSKIKDEKDQIQFLKSLASFDEDFNTNSVKFLQENGMTTVKAHRLVNISKIQEVVDYTFTRRLTERGQ